MTEKLLWGHADSSMEELNTSYQRVFIPSTILREHGHLSAETNIANLLYPPTKEIQTTIDAADIIILERLLIDEFADRIDVWHKAGKRVYSTFDDAYHLMPYEKGSPSETWRGGKNHKLWDFPNGKEKRGAILNEFRKILRLVDSAFVPSKLLADDYRPYCPTIQVVQNVPYKPMWDSAQKRPPDGTFVIGWGGTSLHYISWRDSHLASALGAICRKYPRVQVHIQSVDPRILIPLDKFNVRYTAHGRVPFDNWPKIAARFDLCVVPMAGAYDDRRSPLKLIEAGMTRTAFVASDCAAYHDYGFGGQLVENKPSAWINAISGMIEDSEKRERLAQAGYDWAVSLYEGASEMYERALGLNGET